jgi:hypothetical protein
MDPVKVNQWIANLRMVISIYWQSILSDKFQLILIVSALNESLKSK